MDGERHGNQCLPVATLDHRMVRGREKRWTEACCADSQGLCEVSDPAQFTSPIERREFYGTCDFLIAWIDCPLP